MSSASNFYSSGSGIHSCEVLIIGAGIGGTTLAHELAKHNIDVIIIEEGPYVENISKRNQAQNFSEVWRNGGLTVALGETPIAYAEARCVGGGSEINSAIFQRASAEVLDSCASKYNIAEFTRKSLDPFYDQAEQMVGASEQLFKTDSILLENAAKKLGWRYESLKVAQRDGDKQPISKILLPIALDKGVHLIALCRAKKIIFKQDRVVRVHAEAHDEEGRSHAIVFKPQYVFVCSGAIYTPFLLLKNGIRKNIGKTLQLHPMIKTLCDFQMPTSSYAAPVTSCAITEFMPKIRIGGSVMSECFIAMAIAEDWQHRCHLLEYIDQCGLYYAMIKPEGIGRIRYIPGYDTPIVQYRLTKNDYKSLFLALYYLQKIMFTAGAKTVYPALKHHPGWKQEVTLEDIYHLNYRDMNLMAIHLFSSCLMGEDKNICSVNSYGKLHNYENIYLNDASIIPEALGTNPQNTIMALAIRNAKHFVDYLSGHYQEI